MEEFNNIELNDEELDQVAGGQKYVHLWRRDDGVVEYNWFYGDDNVDELKKLLAGGSSIEFSSSSAGGHGTISSPGLLEKKLKRWEERGYTIIKQWEL